jgi:putative transcriptional regulator
MEEFSYTEIKKGTFLISTPEIDSGVFFRSVILLCESTATGSFGIAINKPLDIELPEEVLSLSSLENPNIDLRAGGPVQANQMMLLHSCSDIPNETLEVTDGVFLGGDLQFLQDAISDLEGPKVRLCFGYAGWGSGQLEREVLEGSWYACPGDAHYVFDLPAEKIWQTILKDMGGKYAALSMIPEDLSLN